jgi:tetratricopeptide (TPR) repeat protein
MTNKSKKSRNIIGVVLVVLIGLVAWSMVSAMGSREKPDDDKHLGIAEYEKGNYQEAIKHYDNGVKSTPDDACLFNNRGLAYYSLEQYDKAVADYNRILEKGPHTILSREKKQYQILQK